MFKKKVVVVSDAYKLTTFELSYEIYFFKVESQLGLPSNASEYENLRQKLQIQNLFFITPQPY